MSPRPPDSELLPLAKPLRLHRRQRLALRLGGAAALLAAAILLAVGAAPGVVLGVALLAACGFFFLAQDVLDPASASPRASVPPLALDPEALRDLAESQPYILLIAGADGACTFINRRWTEFTGLAVEAALGDGWLRCIHPDERIATQRAYRAAIDYQDRFDAPVRMRRADGEWRRLIAQGMPRFDSQGAYLGMVGSLIDITERDKAESALRASEARFRRALDDAPIPAAIHDENEALVFINRRFLEITAYPREQLRSLELWLQRVAPAEHPPVLAALRACAAQAGGGPLALGALSVHCGDGSVRDWELYSAPLEGLPGELRSTLILAVDATERMLAERARARSETRFRNAIEDAAMPIAIHAEDGEMLMLNRAWRRITGYELSEIPNIARWTELAYEPQRGAEVLAGIRARYAIAEPSYAGEFTPRCKDGSYRVWDIWVAPLERMDDGRRVAIATVSDVTERRAAERALRQSEMRYRELFEVNPHPMWVFDQQSYAFLAVNEAAIEHYGYSREEFLAMTVLDIRPQDEVARTRAEIDSWDANTGVAGGIWRHRTRDGREIMVETARHAVHFDGRAAYIVLAHDVSERLRAEAQIRALNAELEQRVAARTAQLKAANRELETFAYSVSHDLKAPLRAIDGYSALLQEDHAASLPASGAHYLASIRRGARQMNALIEDLLAYSRVERGTQQLSPVRLDERVRQALAEQQTQIEGLGVVVELALAPLEVSGDPEGLGQALRNLIENALKFSATAQPPRLRISSRCEGGKVCLCVADNGIGFDMAYHDRIFEIFQRLHVAGDYPGTGIGLALVRKAMERMGGRVWAESAPGQGARFYIEMAQWSVEAADSPA